MHKEKFGQGIMMGQEGVFTEVPSETQMSVWVGLRERTKTVTQKKGKSFFYSLRGKWGSRKRAQSVCNLGCECSRQKGQLQILYKLSCYFSRKTEFLSATV